MKDGLELLYKLQQHEDIEAETRLRIAEIPKTIESLEEDRDGKADIVQKSKEKLEENLKNREKFEKEILLVGGGGQPQLSLMLNGMCGPTKEIFPIIAPRLLEDVLPVPADQRIEAGNHLQRRSVILVSAW